MFTEERPRSPSGEARIAGPYTLERKIAEGGMGEVWSARHNVLARKAAIKLIRPDRLEDGGAVARRVHELFVREAQATAALRSPHTVELYDFGLTGDGRYYYAMQYLDGLSLETLTDKYGPIPAERTVFLLQQACASLHEAHRRGLVHGDIKPANIVSCCLGGLFDFVKVLDFGLVRQDGSLDLTDEPTFDDVTPGTPAFMPPEVALGRKQIDGRSDVYALGCVGYFLLTATRVFDGESPVATVVDHVQKPPEPPSLRTEMEIPEALERIILRCLEKELDDRFQGADELAAALAAVPLTRAWSDARAAEWWALNEPEIGRLEQRIALSAADLPPREGEPGTRRRTTAGSPPLRSVPSSGRSATIAR